MTSCYHSRRAAVDARAAQARMGGVPAGSEPNEAAEERAAGAARLP